MKTIKLTDSQFDNLYMLLVLLNNDVIDEYEYFGDEDVLKELKKRIKGVQKVLNNALDAEKKAKEDHQK